MSIYCNNHHQALTLGVSAPGKVILHGEHSVVYGKLAIAGSLDLRTKIKLVEVEQRRIGIELKALNLSQNYSLDVGKTATKSGSFCYNLLLFQDVVIDLSKRSLPLLKTTSNFNIEHPELINHDALLKLIEDFIKTYTENSPLDYFQQLSLTTVFYLFHSMTASIDVTIKPFDLIIETDLVVSGGTGSSASFCVCVAAILYQYIRVKTANCDNISKNAFKPCKITTNDLKKFEKEDLDLISRWAYCAERIIHGTPSGVDNTVCTYGSLVEFSKSSGAKQLDMPSKFRILLVNTKVPKDTKAMVKRTSVLKERHGGVVEAVFEGLDAVAREALECFKCLNREFLRIDTYKEQKLVVKELYQRLGVSKYRGRCV